MESNFELQLIICKDNRLWCPDPQKYFFNDAEEAQMEHLLQSLTFEPQKGWSTEIRFAAFEDVPTVYMVCLLDQILPPKVQEEFAALANARTVSCDVGHMPNMVKPHVLADFILENIREIV